MRQFRFLIPIVAGLIVANCSNGAEPANAWWQALYPARRPGPSCPCDYMAKPLPCVAPVCARGPNDYCAKPLPDVCPMQRGSTDDYCRKTCPILLPQCPPPWYSCGTAGPCVPRK
jgi:hypothetical protein